MNVSKTTIDWLRFRAKEEPPVILRALRPMFGDLANFLKLDTGEKGMLGFKQAARVMLLDVPIGRMDYGGDSQRDWVRVDLSLIDWKMRSSRNREVLEYGFELSLIDWKMRSSRNICKDSDEIYTSLIDWKMRSSRNL